MLASAPEADDSTALSEPLPATRPGEVLIRGRTAALNLQAGHVAAASPAAISTTTSGSCGEPMWPAKSAAPELRIVVAHPAPHSRRFGIGGVRRGRSPSRDGSGAPQPFRRSLIGFDGSAAAMGALHHAARAARSNRGRLVVVSVVRKPIEVVAAWPFVVAAPPSASPEECALAALRAAVESLPMDVPVVTIVSHGRVGPVLLRKAARHLCDEIVVGAATGAWSRLTGAVARYLRSRAAVEVVVVPRENAGALVAASLSAPDSVEFGL